MRAPLSILSLTLLFAVGCAAKIPLANGPETPAAVTHHHSFELFFTVEESPVVAAPTGVHVLSGTVAK